jgi:hypothetical protein
MGEPVRHGRRPATLALAAAAAVTALGAVALDSRVGVHRTHTVVIGLAALIVGIVRLRLSGRFDDVFPAVCGAIVSQPALHATAASESSALGAGLTGPMHVVAADGPAGLIDAVTPAVVVLALVFCSRLIALLLSVLRRPTRRSAPNPVDTEDPVRIAAAHTPPMGAMLLSSCGWALQTARRGPPRPVCF